MNIFLLGHHDRQLAAFVAAVKPSSTFEATKLAAEIESICRNLRAKRTVTSVLPEQLSRCEKKKDIGDFEVPMEDVASQTDLIAAFDGYRQNKSARKPRKRRPATSSTKCYNCGQYGPPDSTTVGETAQSNAC